MENLKDLSEVKSIDEMTEEEIKNNKKLQEYFREHNISDTAYYDARSSIKAH